MHTLVDKADMEGEWEHTSDIEPMWKPVQCSTLPGMMSFLFSAIFDYEDNKWPPVFCISLFLSSLQYRGQKDKGKEKQRKIERSALKVKKEDRHKSAALCEQWRRDETIKETQRAFSPAN